MDFKAAKYSKRSRLTKVDHFLYVRLSQARPVVAQFCRQFSRLPTIFGTLGSQPTPDSGWEEGSVSGRGMTFPGNTGFRLGDLFIRRDPATRGILACRQSGASGSRNRGETNALHQSEGSLAHLNVVMS